MRTTLSVLLAGAAFALGVASAVRWQGAHAPAAPASAPGEASSRRVLYWYDPMVPGQHFDQPGKSPYMDMALVPRYADAEATAAGEVGIDPRLVQNLGVRSVVARRGVLATVTRASGVLAFDEGAVSLVQARVGGIVEHLAVRTPLAPVRRGQVLLTLLAPEWTAAQEDYLALRGSGVDALRSAARRRLRLLGMDEAQIAAMEREGRARVAFALTAPRDGVVGDLAVREGASVQAGSPLLRVNGLDALWLDVAVPEAQIAQVAVGARAVAQLPAFPDEDVVGAVAALLPQVDAGSRTLTARVVLQNPDHRLAPGMYAEVAIDGPARAAQVLVPTEAVIATGTRRVVIVAEGQGRFRAQEVRTGIEADGQTVVREGVREGERVVASGQFLIDSEASLRGALARLQGQGEAAAGEGVPAAAAGQAPAGQEEALDATGRIVAIDGTRWRIATDAIPALEMGAMAMDFVVPDDVGGGALRTGQRVRLRFVRGDADFVVTYIAAESASAPPHGDHAPGGAP